MVAEMKIIQVISNVDKFVIDLLKDFNEGLSQLKSKLGNYLFSMSFIWGFMVLLYQIFEYLRLGIWKQMSPYSEGFLINSTFIGFDKIINFVLDLHPFFSFPAISFFGIYILYFLFRIIYITLIVSYSLAKRFVSFWYIELK